MTKGRGAADPGSWNRYGYTRGDPMNRFDDTGLSDTCPDCLDGVTAYAFADRGYQGASGAFQGTNWAWVAMNLAATKGQLLPTLQGATPQQQKEFTNALKDALNRLKKKKDCAKDLGGDAMTTLLNASFTYGLPMGQDANGNLTPFDSGIYAVTNVEQQTVTINGIGHFFNFFTPGPNGGVLAYHMGTGLGQTDFDAFVLLHELGHLNGVLGDDRKDPSLADKFNQKILKDCFGVNWTPPPSQ